MEGSECLGPEGKEQAFRKKKKKGHRPIKRLDGAGRGIQWADLPLVGVLHLHHHATAGAGELVDHHPGVVAVDVYGDLKFAQSGKSERDGSTMRKVSPRR